MQVKVKTPAKINLTMEVLNKRPDGFHNIQSVMQMIDLYDYLTIEVKSRIMKKILFIKPQNSILIKPV